MPNINDEREIRLKKLAELRQIDINPYPAKSVKKHTLQQALDAKEDGIAGCRTDNDQARNGQADFLSFAR